ncbi:DNA cytosine methyltransferase [Burkholderia stagnalis]|uniref:DNA cytosine methyltransferase n=1 Tax=Burkholderia stagnalis TaxID=1503054 RepID=UPI00075FD432|nr:DNA cytosine methyltransferase [Burkholderia stagnalis]KWN68478.1 cytosine methyltransferase [Burkholderia stagnalis]
MTRYYEFFAGGGMVRAGLGKAWQCLFANDFDPKKGRSYQENWKGNSLRVCDVATISTSDLPAQADLAWASFPCQDLSLAGAGAGLKGERSGTFWPFWKLMTQLRVEGRAPQIVALENVCGAITSHGGKDFVAICESLAEESYRLGAMVIDAAHFVPQSRPRLFIIGIRDDVVLPEGTTLESPSSLWHTKALVDAHKKLSPKAKHNWIWWNLPPSRGKRDSFANIIESDPMDVAWHTEEQTQQLLAMMSDVNVAKVKAAQALGKRIVGTIYRRTRHDEYGRKVQRAEVRFDDTAGCLRTPAGGSSRQTIMVVEGDRIRSRLMSSRETARLMGLPDTYKLPEKYNEAYHLTGDGVAVPVVRHLAKHIFEPILTHINLTAKVAA